MYLIKYSLKNNISENFESTFKKAFDLNFKTGSPVILKNIDDDSEAIFHLGTYYSVKSFKKSFPGFIFY